MPLMRAHGCGLILKRFVHLRAEGGASLYHEAFGAAEAGGVPADTGDRQREHHNGGPFYARRFGCTRSLRRQPPLACPSATCCRVPPGATGRWERLHGARELADGVSDGRRRRNARLGGRWPMANVHGGHRSQQGVVHRLDPRPNAVKSWSRLEISPAANRPTTATAGLARTYQ